MKLKVIKPFRDKVTQKKVDAGQVISIDELDRVNDLVARGFCVITDVNNSNNDGSGKSDLPSGITLFEKEFDLKVVKEALGTIDVKVAANAGVAAVEKKVSELTDEQKTALLEALGK